MTDFNTVCSELIKHLRLSVQRPDGEIRWDEGTLELLAELLSFAVRKPRTNADKIRALTDAELAVWISALYTTQYHTGAEPHIWLEWLRREVET